jgi:glycosyltransferase involved in cell wall biosynthesis
MGEFNKPAALSESILKIKEAGNKIVLYAGRLTVQKGVDYLIKSAKRVLEHYPNAFFVIAGTGDMERQLINQAAYDGIGDKVIFTGFYNREEANTLFKTADLVILPSVSEPFGIVPLEAMANNTPVIISKQSGVSEVLSHVLKVDFWDVDEMTNKILSVLEHDSLKNCMAENGKSEVVKITWDSAAEKCLHIYKMLLSPVGA